MKNLSNLIVVIFSLLILGCTHNQTDKEREEEYNLCVSPFKPLLFSEDHTSEGFLAPLDDGRILLLFRLDPGIEGDHVGTDGYIAKIPYDPEEDEWGEVDTVYNSHQYDDRNIHGGVTRNGRIVTFFRRYDGSETEGRYFIYSDDNGKTWSNLQVNKAMSDPEVRDLKRGNMSTGLMFYNPNIGKYIKLGWVCKRPEEEITYRYTLLSPDGSSWDEYNIVPEDAAYMLNEIAGAWCGNNRIIALHRDDKREQGHPLVQVTSYDNGETWSEPAQTNMPPNKHWGGGPQLIYSQKFDLLIALTSDRYSRPLEENSLYIYSARPDEVIGNPEGWRLQHELRRPWAKLDFDGNRPLNQNLYGYPTIAPINEEEYLVVFTERARMQGTEQADLYYFRLLISR